MNKEDVKGIGEIIGDLTGRIIIIEAKVEALKEAAILQGLDEEILSNIFNKKLKVAIDEVIAKR